MVSLSPLAYVASLIFVVSKGNNFFIFCRVYWYLIPSFRLADVGVGTSSLYMHICPFVLITWAMVCWAVIAHPTSMNQRFPIAVVFVFFVLRSPHGGGSIEWPRRRRIFSYKPWCKPRRPNVSLSHMPGRWNERGSQWDWLKVQRWLSVDSKTGFFTPGEAGRGEEMDKHS